jgi:hypothetical protein
MSEIINELKNPFNGCALEVRSAKSENRISKEAMKLMLEEAPIHDENEFYVLFENGILIKKERSKFRTSNYIMGNKFKSIKQYYNEEV